MRSMVEGFPRTTTHLPSTQISAAHPPKASLVKGRGTARSVVEGFLRTTTYQQKRTSGGVTPQTSQ